MPIEFTCPQPNCGEALSAADHLAGRKVRCPKCQTFVLIPSPRGGKVVFPGRMTLHLACGMLLLFFVAVLTTAFIRCAAPSRSSSDENASSVEPTREKEPAAPATAEEKEPAQATPKARKFLPAKESEPEDKPMPAPPSEEALPKDAPPPAPKPPKSKTAAAAPQTLRKQWLKFLKDKLPENRRHAVKILGQTKDSAVIPLLVKALEDPDASVRDEAKASLTGMDPTLVAAAKEQREREKGSRSLSLEKNVSAYADMSQLNELIHKGDFSNARTRAKFCALKYPEEIKIKLANLDRIDALRKKCFERVNSGAARVEMRRICSRYAFAGMCKRAGEDGLTAAIAMPWDKFSKMEVARFYGETADPKSGEDQIATAAFLVEGGFGKEEVELALSFLDKADQCGGDAAPMRKYISALRKRQQDALKQQVHPDLASDFLEAKGKSRRLLVYFWASEQKPCLRMDSTFQSGTTQRILSLYYHWVKLDIGNFENHFECCRAYGVEDLPYVIVFDGKGRRIASIAGYVKVVPFKAFLEGAVLSARR